MAYVFLKAMRHGVLAWLGRLILSGEGMTCKAVLGKTDRHLIQLVVNADEAIGKFKQVHASGTSERRAAPRSCFPYRASEHARALDTHSRTARHARHPSVKYMREGKRKRA